jgi:AcrR family transcriptional regulator
VDSADTARDHAVREGRRIAIEDIRRSELVDAAIGVIAEHGFDRTTVRDIARSAGAAAGSVHYYFKNKDELLQAAFDELEMRFRDRVAETLAAVESPRDQLVALVEVFWSDGADITQGWVVQFDVWQQAGRHETFRETFVEAHNWWVELIGKTLEAGVAQGEFRPIADVRREATELAALMDGLGIYYATNQVESAFAREIVLGRVHDLAP